MSRPGEVERGDPGPTLVLFCGLPGSGKSTLARRLESAGRGVRLSADEWQADLGVGHGDTDFHGRLQDRLYRHALTLLRRGTDVILEDGLWRTDERAEKFTDARSCSARIELHVFDVDHETLWGRLRQRNDQAASASYPMTEAELRWAENVFQPISAQELTQVDRWTRHRGGHD
jgi:predicted kinase